MKISDKQLRILQSILGSLELEVMKIAWRMEKVTVQEVVNQLQLQKKYAYTTIMTIMSRLVDKKVLKREKTGRIYVYQPTHDLHTFINQISSEKIHHLLNQFGDIAIAQFVDVVGSKPIQLQKLKNLIQDIDQEGEK